MESVLPPSYTQTHTSRPLHNPTYSPHSFSSPVATCPPSPALSLYQSYSSFPTSTPSTHTHAPFHPHSHVPAPPLPHTSLRHTHAMGGGVTLPQTLSALHNMSVSWAHDLIKVELLQLGCIGHWHASRFSPGTYIFFFYFFLA